MDSILLEHNQYGKILILNYDNSFLDFFEGVIFGDYETSLKLNSQDHDGILKFIEDYSIKSVLMEICSRDDGTLDRGLKLFRSIKDLSGQIQIIICSIKSVEEIKRHIPGINKDRIYYLSGKGLRSNESNQEYLENIIDYILEKLSSATYIHDKWVLESLSNLNKGSGFKKIDPGFRPFLNLIGIDVKRFKRINYLNWIHNIRNKMMDKHLQMIFKNSRLKYIKDAIENFMWLEPLSYIEPFYSKKRKRYRDHFLHQLRIAVLGNFLLDVHLDEKTRLIDSINSSLRSHHLSYIFPDFKNGSHESTVNNCRLSWWFTALMHDYTYPLHFIFEPFLFNEKNREQMLKTYIVDFLDPFINSHNLTIKRFRKEFGKNLSNFLETVKIEDTIKRHILKRIDSKLSHNITGAFNLWQIHKRQKEKNKNLCTELACQSILLHHSFTEDKIADFKSISFIRYPLAFLLILLDEIQDWGRPAILPYNQEYPTKKKDNIDLDKIEITGISQKMEDSNKWYFNDKKIIITLDYSKKNNVESSAVHGIIDSKKRNLRRLNIDNDKLPDILVRLKFKGPGPHEIYSDNITIERRQI